MKRLIYFIIGFGLILVLFDYQGGDKNSNSEVRMIHYLEVTFPQMEKNNGTH